MTTQIDFPIDPTMKTQTTLKRIKFSDVPVGQRFYDPISAEYFVKQSATMAAMVTGAGDGTVADEFEADDVVGIEQA
jgi:carbohydrate-binding DOMON domain-containing protein